MTAKQQLHSLNTRLCLVFVSMLAIMFLYELAKQALSPDITLWQSHAITIVFTSAVAVVIAYFPLRSAHCEQMRAQDALRHQLEAEERLRRSEVQYRSFVESVEDSIYTVDPDLRYLLINARHLVRRGLSPELYAGKHYGDFHTPEETRIFTAQVLRVLESRIPVQDEYEQNGRHYLRRLSPVIDPVAHEVIAVTVISTDITERRAAERSLEITNKKLSLMNEITRHDMLNQLSVLSSYLALAAEQEGESAIRRYLAKSEQVVDTIHAQICFSRDYQRIGVRSPQWQNLAATIRRAGLPLKMTPVIIDKRCADFEILADPLLEKVFYNILDNAVRYAGPHPGVRFFIAEEPERLVLVCEDRGPGILIENKEKIFQRGFGKNTGLGLFLIREILAITGITIRETGKEGNGCRFEIVTPKGFFRQRSALVESV